MLERLDDVDWGRLSHAYGPASDVPGLIRALASPEDDVRESAVHELFGNVWHQSTVYEATAFAVPFLIELLAHAELQSRRWILMLLGSIARGQSYIEQHHGVSFVMQALGSPEQRERQLERERAWVAAARSAVAVGFDLYVRLLRDADPLVRTTAPYPMLAFAERISGIVPALWRVVEHDEDSRTRASAMLGLSLILEPGTDLSRFERLIQVDKPDAVRLGASMALARIATASTPMEAVLVLCNAVIDPAPFKQMFEWWPWAEHGEPGQYLKEIGSAQRRYAVDLLLNGLMITAADQLGIVLLTLLDLEFDIYKTASGTPYGILGLKPLDPDELKSEQRALLLRVLPIDRLWDGDWPPGNVVRHYGLPPTRNELARYLGL